MVSFSDGARSASAVLGTNASTVTPLSLGKSFAAFREARRDRFRRRAQSSKWLVQASRDEFGESWIEAAPRPATCGWSAGSHVGVMRGDGPARFTGVQSCASVHSCAHCGAIIRGRRAVEVQDASKWWENTQGGSFLFLTLTVRHKAEDSLERTADALTAAFTSMIKGAPWRRFSRRHGVRHFIKSQEVTLGWANGWHAHLHVLLFVDLHGAARDLAQDARDAWQAVRENPTVKGLPNASRVKKAKRLDEDAAEAARIAAQGIGVQRKKELHGWLADHWTDAVVARGGRRPSRHRGVDIRTVRDGNVVALYISKLQEGDRLQWAVGNEMARADVKKGRLDSLVPLELLDVDGLTPEQVERQRAYWVEYVRTMVGRRAMTWSRGLKELAGIEEVDDEEVVEAEDAEAAADERVIVIAAKHWAAIKYDGDALARILELVEADRVDEVSGIVPFDYPPPL